MQNPCESKSFNLNVKIGKVYKIMGYKPNITFLYKRRLLELGFVSGEEITFLKKSMQGKTFLVFVRNVVFTIDAKLLGQIILGGEE